MEGGGQPGCLFEARPRQGHEEGWCAMQKMVLMAAAALALAACDNVAQNAEELRSDAGAAIDEQALARAVGSAVDEKAVEGLVRGAVDGAVKEAVREALPMAEIEAVGAVVDEEALARELDEAVDGKALGSAVRGVLEGAAEEQDPAR